MLLSNEQKRYFLNLTPDDITAEFIINNFADKSEIKDGKVVIIPSKYKTNDTMVLEKNEYFNSEKITTNLGLFIYNKLIIEKNLSEITGYVNTTITSKVHEQIESKITNALLNDNITVETMVEYLDTLEWLTKQFNSVFSGSFTMKTLKPVPSAIKLRDKLIKENKDKLEKGDIVTAVNIENEVKAEAKKVLKNDVGMDLYDSGARGSFDNNYKNIALMRGPVFNPTTGKWDTVQSNFMEGIDKGDIPSYGNSVVTSAYPKAVGTQVSGYLSKQLIAALQTIMLDKPGSDCGTKNHIDVLVTPWIKKDLMYRYIKSGNSYILLDETNIDKYMNTRVKLRSPMYCESEKLCSICAGKMYEKLGIENIGLTSSKVSTTILNLNMKKFHNSTASLYKIDLNKLTL